MLEIARRKHPDVELHQGDMTRLDLGRRFDAIVCLFSSIAYVRTDANLARTLRAFAAHLEPGGLMVIETFVDPEAYTPGTPHMICADDEDVKVARLNVAERRGDLAVLEFHFLIATGAGVRHLTDQHELALYERGRVLELMGEQDLDARFVEDGLMEDRGLFVGIKKP